MNVKEAKAIAREWVIDNATGSPDFCGAVYHGSVNWLDDAAEFPAGSDLDVLSFYLPQPPTITGKFCYKDLVLEISGLPLEEIQTPEQILGNYWLAGSFKGPNILADPSGRLEKLQAVTVKNYHKRHWVEKRCAAAEANALRFLERSRTSDQSGISEPLHVQVTNWLFARGVMAHILLVAGLKNPTVRRRYVDLRHLLLQYGHPDFYEDLLALSGFARMDPLRVERHLSGMSQAFDAAASVIQTPYRFAADISADARPVAIDGTERLIRSGFHREALFWIVATYCRCQHILLTDGSPEVQNKHSEGFHRLLDDLGIGSAAGWSSSQRQAEDFLPRVRQLAQSIMRANPEIED